MTLLLVTVALTLTVGHALVNSFHDAPNTTAVPVRHRALSARRALWLVAGLNIVGVVAAAVLFPLAQIHHTVMERIDPVPALGAIIGALLTVIGWNLFTW